MLNLTFTSLYADAGSVMNTVTTADFLLCCLASVLLGIVSACAYMFRNEYSKGFVVTLASLPLIVQTVITLVNGNLGAGIAVMGVFSLVRFRSVPGSAKDIASVFLAMAIGLATGMGYLGLAALFTVVVTLVNICLALSPLGRVNARDLSLHITVPEDLEFDGMFDQVLARHVSRFRLDKVQTTNMGSLFQLEYTIRLANSANSKAMIDDLRCLNGNLKISLCYSPSREGL